MIAKTPEDKEGMRRAGKLLASVLRATAGECKAGVSTAALNMFAEGEIRAGGATPVFLGYETDDSPYPYPASLCVTINDEVAHGIPAEDRLLKEGDIVSLDMGLTLGGYVVDAAVMVAVGEIDEDAKRLIEGSKKALGVAIAAAKADNRAGDIGAAVMEVAKQYGLDIVRDLGGHGIGRELHEPPFIANFGTAGKGEKLLPGLVIALEPHLTLKSGAIVTGDDGWTYKTKDRSRAAHYEHTILITEKGAEILTQ